MRRPFMAAFGRTPTGRRLAAAAWPAFHAALLHGSGIATARSHGQVAADERNARSVLVPRWSASRVEETVNRAVRAAGQAC
jgi:hypothetical protein